MISIILLPFTPRCHLKIRTFQAYPPRALVYAIFAPAGTS